MFFLELLHNPLTGGSPHYNSQSNLLFNITLVSCIVTCSNPSARPQWAAIYGRSLFSVILSTQSTRAYSYIKR